MGKIDMQDATKKKSNAAISLLKATYYGSTASADWFAAELTNGKIITMSVPN